MPPLSQAKPHLLRYLKKRPQMKGRNGPTSLSEFSKRRRAPAKGS